MTYYMCNFYYNTDIQVSPPQICFDSISFPINYTWDHNTEDEIFKCVNGCAQVTTWVNQIPNSSGKVPLLDTVLKNNLFLRKIKNIIHTHMVWRERKRERDISHKKNMWGNKLIHIIWLGISQFPLFTQEHSESCALDSFVLGKAI